jgi:signal transduction histidine kinase/ActR/RegA family two-component response regulator
MELPETIVTMSRLLPAAALIVTRDGRVLFANAEARASFAPLISHVETLYDLLVDDRDAVSDYLRICARSMTSIPGGFRVRRDGGDHVPYLTHGAVVAPRNEHRPSLVLLRFEPKHVRNPFILLNQTIQELMNEVKRRRDAETALRDSEKALQDRVADAEEANRLKDYFLATVSHELRTPLNAILGWATMISNENVDDARRARGLEVIERNARLQVSLIDELLDVSRIISGKMRLDVQTLNPIDAIQAAVEAVRPAIEAKGIRLQSVLDPLAGPVSGDPERIQQVLWNLLNNAAKFTPKGGRIHVVLERIDSNIEISVSDTGSGIKAEFLPHVFDRFRQQDGAITRSHSGLGLGLAITKSLVELHGGTIRASSEGEGRGSTFVIQLPRTLVKSESVTRPFKSAPSKEPAKCPPELNDLRILAVDDEQDALEMLATLLEDCGASVTTARSAREALELVQSMRPDVLISDIGMPEQDGYSLVRQVRRLPRDLGGGTAAIALTAYARTEDRTRALTSGFQAHVPKPVEPAELFAVIASVCGRFTD